MDGQASTGYELRVVGWLDTRWEEWFDGFTVSEEADGTTTLKGAVADQAQLHRILAKIRDLGLELLSVEAVRFHQVPGSAATGPPTFQ